MAADSFKITDRRSAYTDGKDQENKTPSVPVPPEKPARQPDQPAPPKRVQPEPPPQASFDADLPEQPDEYPEGDEFDEMPEEPLDTPRGPQPSRGAGRGTPFSMRPIELTHSLLGLLVQKAYVSLGLMPNPETGRMKRDLEDAGESIELLEVLLKHFSGKWQVPGMEAELQNQLTNLRLQYARLKG